MEVAVTEEKENVFFNRKEVKLVVKHEKAATPSKEAIKKALAEKYGVDPEQVLVDYIFSKAGLPESIVKAKILKEKPKKEEKKNEAQNSAGGKSTKQ